MAKKKSESSRRFFSSKQVNGKEDDEDVPYSEMTEDQKRRVDVSRFQRDLNKTKPYFANIEGEIVPIVEARELEEES